MAGFDRNRGFPVVRERSANQTDEGVLVLVSREFVMSFSADRTLCELKKSRCYDRRWAIGRVRGPSSVCVLLVLE